MPGAPEDRLPRLPSLDAAKGIAIVLVVGFHVWRSLIHAGRLAEPWYLDGLRTAVYTFHVPIFFVIAGMVLRDPAGRGHFSDLARRIVYPYVVWSLLQGFLVAAAGSAANNPVRFADVIPSLVWRPLHQFWFLHALIAVLALVGLAARAGWSRAGTLAGAVALFAVVGMLPVPGDLVSIGSGGWWLALGYWIGRPARLPPAWTALPAFAVLGATVAAGLHELPGLRTALGALGIWGTLAVAGRWPLRPLRELGRASLAIYIGHVLAATPARLLPWPLASALALGIGVPYVLWRVENRYGLPIFRWPSRAPGGAAPRSAAA